VRTVAHCARQQAVISLYSARSSAPRQWQLSITLLLLLLCTTAAVVFGAAVDAAVASVQVTDTGRMCKLWWCAAPAPLLAMLLHIPL
jgi:hypothetical protein